MPSSAVVDPVDGLKPLGVPSIPAAMNVGRQDQIRPPVEGVDISWQSVPAVLWWKFERIFITSIHNHIVHQSGEGRELTTTIYLRGPLASQASQPHDGPGGATTDYRPASRIRAIMLLQIKQRRASCHQQDHSHHQTHRATIARATHSWGKISKTKTQHPNSR